MSSVTVKFLEISGVDLKIGVSSVDFTFCSPVAYLVHIFFCNFDGRVSSVGLIFECRMLGNFLPQCRMSD